MGFKDLSDDEKAALVMGVVPIPLASGIYGATKAKKGRKFAVGARMQGRSFVEAAAGATPGTILSAAPIPGRGGAVVRGVGHVAGYAGGAAGSGHGSLAAYRNAQKRGDLKPVGKSLVEMSRVVNGFPWTREAGVGMSGNEYLVSKAFRLLDLRELDDVVDKGLNVEQLTRHFSNKLARRSIRSGGIMKPKKGKYGSMTMDAGAPAVGSRMVAPPSPSTPKGMVETRPGARTGNRQAASQAYRANLENIARTMPARQEGLMARGQLERWNRGVQRRERVRSGLEAPRVSTRRSSSPWD